MKNLLYFATIMSFVIVTSCRSIEKMVEQGKYDEAIQFATNKLAGQKNKKTNQVKGLEKAFIKVNRADFDRIEFLKSQDDDSNWAEIHTLTHKVIDRQERIEPFLPLISKDGYRADFEFINMTAMAIESRNKAAAFAYELGSSTLSKALNTNDKELSRDAYYQLKRVKYYFNQYEDLDNRLALAENTGIVRILVKWDERTVRDLPFRPELSTQDLNINKLSNAWTEYHTINNANINYDLITTIILDDILISPEIENVETFTENKRIEIASVTSEIETSDSTKIVEIIKEFDNVSATVEVVRREKRADLRGVAETRDAATGELVFRDNLISNVLFSNEFSNIYGDARALSNQNNRYLNLRALDFPPNYAMIEQGISDINRSIEKHLRKIRI